MGLILSGCSDGLRSNFTPESVNVVPETFEHPERDQQEGNDQDQEDQQTQKPPENTKPGTLPKNSQKDPSRIMYYAQKIMETEGRRLGTACNFYVHRVLQVAGFVYDVFLANDFDDYAKRYFKHYKEVDFYRDTSNAEEIRLKQHIWSYPERTPFIVNWTRASVHGHIAFIERIGEKLVIYQSSLGTKTPRKDQTTPEILLNGYNRRQLTVYSEMTPK